MKKGCNKEKVLGVGVVSTSVSGVLEKIDGFVTKTGKLRLIVTVNSEFVMQAQDDPEFKKVLNSADLAIPDGVGLKVAGVKEILPGRKLVEALIGKGYRMFYLGGRDGVAHAMSRKYGGSYDSGHKDIRSQILDSKENGRIINKINKFKPDILLVAYGAPWQEKWLFANRSSLTVKVGMGVGGAFNYLTGRVVLPPEWINKIGLEWLWRLLREPWRWRRQLNLIRFVLLQTFSSQR